MSDSHGGYYLLQTDPDLESFRRLYLLDWDEFDADTGKVAAEFVEEHHLTVTPAPGSDALLLQVHGPYNRDGDAHVWYRENHRLAASLSGVSRGRVYAYSYENQVGTETIAVFEDGREIHAEESDDGVPTPEDELPLSRLARALGLNRDELTFELPLMSRSVVVPLNPDADLGPARAELAALRAEIAAQAPGRAGEPTEHAIPIPAPLSSSELAQERTLDAQWEAKAARRHARSREWSKTLVTALVSLGAALPLVLVIVMIRDGLGGGRGDTTSGTLNVGTVGVAALIFFMLRRMQKAASPS